jgi:hypothetical protein
MNTQMDTLRRLLEEIRMGIATIRRLVTRLQARYARRKQQEAARRRKQQEAAQTP